MKVIDLLNKIANGEELPEKIRYNNNIYEYISLWEQYVDEVTEKPLLKEISDYNYSGLNDEVEIIEEDNKEDKKIEKLYAKLDFSPDGNHLVNNVPDNIQLMEKINEIIDRLNKEE